MKVSITKAAKMAGIQRSTFYRHVEEKGISLEDTDTKRPKVDVSELIRVYGDKLKTIDEVEQKKQSNKNDSATISNTSLEEKIELETLKERVKYLESLQDTEKKRLEEQIDLLKDMLSSEKAERQKATAQLTDQRSAKEKEITRLESLEKLVEDLTKPKDKSWWPFGGKK
ncbi:MAG: hypothetical protein ACRBCK_12420 [Alphaproteobacteria bacterium]